MALNEALYDAGKKILTTIILDNLIPNLEVEKAELKVDEKDKVRLHLNNLILYAYDFRMGEDTREKYEGAVRNTMVLTGLFTENTERVIMQGTVVRLDDLEEVIGWYLTRMPMSN